MSSRHVMKLCCDWLAVSSWPTYATYMMCAFNNPTVSPTSDKAMHMLWCMYDVCYLLRCHIIVIFLSHHCHIFVTSLSYCVTFNLHNSIIIRYDTTSIHNHLSLSCYHIIVISLSHYCHINITPTSHHCHLCVVCVTWCILFNHSIHKTIVFVKSSLI